MSIRWRLTLWFSLILLVILVISGIALNIMLQRYLYDDVDNNLEVYSARSMVRYMVTPPVHSGFNTIHSSLPSINEFSSPGIYIQIIDPDGKVVVKSDNLGNLELPVSPTLIDRGINQGVTIETVAAGDGARVRIMASPLFTPNQTLLLEVAQSLKPLDSVLNQLRLALILGILLALLLTGVLGALLVRRTLAPVERITNIARSIEQGP